VLPSCVVVDLWQSVSEWRLLLSECFGVACRVLELDQRIKFKFLVKLDRSGSEIRGMLVQVYRDNAMKKTVVYKWVTRSSEGRGSVTDKERSATSRTEENIPKVCQVVHKNRQLTVRSRAQHSKQTLTEKQENLN
jgi:hypothetical protein